MTKKPPYKLVQVLWIDSESSPDWTELKSVIQDDTLECVSVGFLLADKEDRIILAASLGLGRDEIVASHVTIPKVAITEIHELRKK